MTLTTERLREIAEDGFLEHGDAKLMARELLANREAQPVAWRYTSRSGDVAFSAIKPILAPGSDVVLPLYTAPPAPAVPAVITAANAPEVFEIAAEVERLGLRGVYGAYAVGWNACRAAMLAAAPEGGNG